MEGRRRSALIRLAALVPLALGLSSCGEQRCDGGVVSCPLRYALTVTVTAQGTGGPVADATIEVTGAVVRTIPCAIEGASTVCRLPGGFGTYAVAVRAPGFHDEILRTTVVGDIGECGCPDPVTRHLQVTMAPRT